MHQNIYDNNITHIWYNFLYKNTYKTDKITRLCVKGKD